MEPEPESESESEAEDGPLTASEFLRAAFSDYNGWFFGVFAFVFAVGALAAAPTLLRLFFAAVAFGFWLTWMNHGFEHVHERRRRTLTSSTPSVGKDWNEMTLHDHVDNVCAGIKFLLLSSLGQNGVFHFTVRMNGDKVPDLETSEWVGDDGES
jgi:hypothetical protein